MGRVIQFEERAVATLRERLGEAESARADLAAFARGHSGAVATIHEAVIAALEADDFDALAAVVTRQWPAMLGLDCVAIGLLIGDQGFRIDVDGNLLCGWGMGKPELDGVRVVSPKGEPIGHIALPERCANLCFGGVHRNRLFMAAATSVFAVRQHARGAGG